MKRLAAAALLWFSSSACHGDPSSPFIAPPASSLSVSGTLRQITNDPYTQKAPVISGDRIAWSDFRNGSYDVYVFDLATGTETRVSDHSGWEDAVDISGDHVTWEDNLSGNWDIYAADLTNGGITRITDEPQTQVYPRISGSRVVWEDGRNGNYDIYMYDLTTNAERRITSDPAFQGVPGISGSRIVWLDHRHSLNGDIYMMDLTTGITTRLTRDGQIRRGPQISGDYIVWEQQDADFNKDVIFYDLSTGLESGIATAPQCQETSPGISGGRVIWVQNCVGTENSYDVWMYDLGTGQKAMLPLYPGFKAGVSVSGDRVAFAFNFDIFVFELSAAKVPAAQAIAGEVSDLVTAGGIDQGTGEALAALLSQVESSLSDSNVTSAIRTLQAFVRLVEARSGHGIDADAAASLIAAAEALISELGG